MWSAAVGLRAGPRWKAAVLVVVLATCSAVALGLGGLGATLEYESWLSAKGVINGGVTLAYFSYPGVPDGGQVKGLSFVRRKENDDRKPPALLTVPRSAALSTTERDSSFSPLPGLATDLQWRQEKILTRLSLLLLAEWQKGSASPLAEYVAMLVALDPLYTPRHWDAESLAVLKSVYPSMAAAVDKEALDYRRLYDALPFASQGVLFERLVWALEIVRSRTFQGFGAVTGSDGEERWLWTCSLLPAIDSVNHHSQRVNCDVAYDASLSSYVLSARGGTGTSPIPQGGEILLSYGDRSNDDLLLNFGFVEPDNPFDCFKTDTTGLTVTKRERETWSVPEGMEDAEIKRILTAHLALLSAGAAAAPSANKNPLLRAFVGEKRTVLLEALKLLD